MKKTPISEGEVTAMQTANGGWTRDVLAGWGVPWPPPHGWKKNILKNGIPYSDVIEIFGSGNIIEEHKPLFCQYCDGKLFHEYRRLNSIKAPVRELTALLAQRSARIVRRTWPTGRVEFACNLCGRSAGNVDGERK